MKSREVRLIQRANSFERAFSRLKAAVKLAEQRELSDLEAQGLIQGFEYTHELAWKTLKNFLEAQGALNLYGSRDTTREAFRNGLIENGEIWMDMVDKRNLTSHTYDEETAAQVVTAICTIYFAEFEALARPSAAAKNRTELLEWNMVCLLKHFRRFEMCSCDIHK